MTPCYKRDFYFFIFFSPKCSLSLSLSLSHTFPFLCRLSPAKPLYETLNSHRAHLANLSGAGIPSEVRVCMLSYWSFFGPTVKSLCPSTSGMDGLPFANCLYPLVWFGPFWNLSKQTPNPQNQTWKLKLWYPSLITQEQLNIWKF